MAIPSLSPPRASDNAAPWFIAVDVGGTHVRMALARASGDPQRPVEIRHYRRRACVDHPGLAAVIEDFLADLPDVDNPAIRALAIASAGHVAEDGTIVSANLRWRISPEDIRRQLGLEHVGVINDFEAMAHAMPYLDANEVLHLAGPRSAPGGSALMVGPGTGLGAAVWLPTAYGGLALATEASQATLPCGGGTERAVFDELLRRHGDHVSMERALSGPGLMNLYTALCAVRGGVPQLDSPDAVTEASAAGEDALATECVELFCALLGRAVGDMALMYGAQRIYLAGGIVPKLHAQLARSQFVERFLDKGPMRTVLERIPVKVIEHGQLGVVGAACWHLSQPASAPPATGPGAATAISP